MTHVVVVLSRSAHYTDDDAPGAGVDIPFPGDSRIIKLGSSPELVYQHMAACIRDLLLSLWGSCKTLSLFLYFFISELNFLYRFIIKLCL